jgi:Ca2+:H+ antiporter
MTAANTMLASMAIVFASVTLPAILYSVLSSDMQDSEEAILVLSRLIALLLLVLFCIYLYFQHKSPVSAFAVEEYGGGGSEDPRHNLGFSSITLVLTILGLLIVIVVLAVCANNIMDAIYFIIGAAGMTKGFVSFVVLPALGYTAGPAAAIIAAYKKKSYLAIDIVVESIMRTTLFVMPFVVILGWIMQQPMQLNFGLLETLCLFLSVFVVGILIQGGKISYLSGAICVAM